MLSGPIEPRVGLSRAKLQQSSPATQEFSVEVVLANAPTAQSQQVLELAPSKSRQQEHSTAWATFSPYFKNVLSKSHQLEVLTWPACTEFYSYENASYFIPVNLQELTIMVEITLMKLKLDPCLRVISILTTFVPDRCRCQCKLYLKKPLLFSINSLDFDITSNSRA